MFLIFDSFNYQHKKSLFMGLKLFFKYFFVVVSIVLVQSFDSSAQQSTKLSSEVKQVIDEYIQKAKDYEQINDFNQASFYYHQAGNTYWTNGILPEAIELFKKSLQMSEHLSNLNGIAVLNTKIGLIYTELKDFNSSISFFTKSLEYFRQIARKQDIVSSLLNVANSNCELDRYNEAIPFLLEAESLSKDISDAKLLRNCYSLMTNVYDKLGDREKSTHYFTLFAAITKKIQQEELIKKENEAKQLVEKANSRVQEVELVQEATVHELKEKKLELREKQINLSKVEQISEEQQMQIDLLNKEKQLQKAEILRQHLMRNIFVGIIIAVLVIAGLTFFGYNKIKRSNILLSQKNKEISFQKDEIEKQAEELKELNALKDKLFSIISHDLRSPLASLINMLTLAKDGHFSADEEKAILNELSKNVEYNTELLENLLKWASSQLKGNVVNPLTFDMCDVAANKVRLYEKAANLKGIKLINEISANSTVFADRDMIEIVLRNLITNAIKFSKSGDKITVTSSQKNGVVEICVTDNGLGISSDTIEKLFGKQIFSTRGTLNEKGTGLGLILCRDFVQLNGGSIWVESVLNKGSKFYFTLPSHAS